MRKFYQIVCINNKSIPGSGSGKMQSLTEGKVYQTYDRPDYNDVCVINDNGTEVNYSSSRFITIEEYRENKLNLLLNN
jgi:hypothetical protein